MVEINMTKASKYFDGQKVVYVGDNCGEMTKVDIMFDIDEWVEETDHFTHLTETELINLKESVYNKLLMVLEWQSPYTVLTEFDEDDITELLEETKLK